MIINQYLNFHVTVHTSCLITPRLKSRRPIMVFKKGRQQEAAKLFLLLLDSKFGAVSQDVQAKIRQATPEEIEKWTKQIFKAETPEAVSKKAPVI